MVDFSKVKAIDFHTHAEEPCNSCRDDGYNEFQAGMAKYFRNPAGVDGMLPTVPQTAAYYRERNIAAVIFPVDAERETGFHRYSNEDVAKLCAENDDILMSRESSDERYIFHHKNQYFHYSRVKATATCPRRPAASR